MQSILNKFNDVIARAQDGIINTDGLKDVLQKVQDNVIVVFGVILGVIGLAAVVYSIVFVVKAGFSNDPEQRKKHIKGLMWLWIAVVGTAILWGLSTAIIAMVGSFGGGTSLF